jgi:hypothetical protein
MRLFAPLLTAFALLTLPLSARPQDHPDDHDRDHSEHTHRFDGHWQTTVTCEPSRGALGFSYRFLSEVNDGDINGLRGTKGQPSSLVLTGSISEDGSGRLYAEGLTGSKEFVPGTDTARGTSFGYHIRAQFDERHGEGTRIEGRACSLQFDRQDDDHHDDHHDR